MAKGFAASYNGINVLIRFILTLFLGVILGAIYRVSKGRVLVGIIWFLTLGLFGIGVLCDLVTTVTSNKYVVLT